ncbi:hypothetical protein BGX38DRAFT_1163353 [Terfezia claveryi]|nr:hypothetical protein BGX38DRAFT_1163353 [Terfezia claveryi]
MPIARLNNGLYLSYQDSGKPQSTKGDEVYDTLVCVHGVMFNQEIFSPLLTANHPALRIVTYNHRGYPGSSPLLPHELIDSCTARKTYVNDLVYFLEYLCFTLELPRKPIVLSWEKGGNILLGLASPTFLPRDTRERGVSNVSCLILHDCPPNGLGRVPTSDIVKAIIACPYPQLTPRPHFEVKGAAATGYCDHHPQLQRQYSSGSTSSFSTSGGDTTEDFPSRTKRHLSWICGFYKHHNHLPQDALPHTYVEPTYSSWAYKCSSELLPQTLLDSAIELENTPQSTPAQSPGHLVYSQFPANPHLWKLSDDRMQQVEFARVALAKQRDIPVGLVWNGESPESTVDAVREAERIGGKVYLLSEGGNSLMFAHEPEEWAVGVRRVARDLVGLRSKRDFVLLPDFQEHGLH